MKRFYSEAASRRSSVGRLAIVAILSILVSALMLHGAVSAADGPPQAVGSPSLREASLPQQGPVCQSCHPGEYDLWKSSPHAGASLDPAFREQLAQAHNQQECLKCHTTGVETGNDGAMAGGVTCEACHGAYQPGHAVGDGSQPGSATMKLPAESSATCRTCHEAAFAGWEASKHAEKNIECFDCHLAHTQGLRTGSVDTLCVACHSDEGTQAAHSRHGISGVNCTSCHMSKQMTSTAAGDAGAQVLESSHSFAVASDVCAGCHGSTIHATGGARAPGNLSVSTTVDGPPQTVSAKDAAELRAEIDGLQQRLDSLRDAAVIGIGLAFGTGAFMGLVLALVAVGVRRRNRRAA
jgi:hypothetical protein